MRAVLVAFAMLAYLAACASAPVHYYTLSSIGPGAAVARADAPGTTEPSQMTTKASLPARLSLARLTIPSELDRTQLVRRLDATRVQILDDERWAAPLDDMLRRVLTDDLAQRLGNDAVADPNEPANGERRLSLGVDIRELYGDTHCGVTLRAAWSLKMPPAAAQADGTAADIPTAGEEDIHLPASGCSGAAGLAPQISEALAELSQRIVNRLAQRH